MLSALCALLVAAAAAECTDPITVSTGTLSLYDAVFVSNFSPAPTEAVPYRFIGPNEASELITENSQVMFSTEMWCGSENALYTDESSLGWTLEYCNDTITTASADVTAESSLIQWETTKATEVFSEHSTCCGRDRIYVIQNVGGGENFRFSIESANGEQINGTYSGFNVCPTTDCAVDDDRDSKQGCGFLTRDWTKGKNSKDNWRVNSVYSPAGDYVMLVEAEDTTTEVTYNIQFSPASTLSAGIMSFVVAAAVALLL